MIRFRRLVLSGIAAMTLGASTMAFMQPAAAQYRHHHGDRGGAVAAGVVSGLALGALAAGAANGGYGYDYGPTYYGGPGYAAPVYGPGPGYGGCRVYWRRAWDGARERVRECY